MPDMQTVTFPWSRDGEITANLAIGSLRESLLMWLKTERGIHAETLMVAIGALAGFAAQNAVLEFYLKPGKPIPTNGLVTLTTASGETFYSGDLINAYLVHEATSTYPLWSLIAAAAIDAGLPPTELPDYRDMFRYVASSIGEPDFGIPRAPPNIRPPLPPRKPLAHLCTRPRFNFESTDGPGPAAGHSVAPEHWPLITALVAQQLVSFTKDALKPRTSVALVMESAIAMSKVDPKTVPQVPPRPPA